MSMIGLPQPGIFALGTSAHEFLEFDLRPDVVMDSVVGVLGRLRMPSVAAGGVNVVIAFGSDLWRAVAPAEARRTSLPSSGSGWSAAIMHPPPSTMCGCGS